MLVIRSVGTRERNHVKNDAATRDRHFGRLRYGPQGLASQWSGRQRPSGCGMFNARVRHSSRDYETLTIIGAVSVLRVFTLSTFIFFTRHKNCLRSPPLPLALSRSSFYKSQTHQARLHSKASAQSWHRNSFTAQTLVCLTTDPCLNRARRRYLLGADQMSG